MTTPRPVPRVPTTAQADRNLSVVTIVSLVIWVGAILLVRSCIHG